MCTKQLNAVCGTCIAFGHKKKNMFFGVFLLLLPGWPICRPALPNRATLTHANHPLPSFTHPVLAGTQLSPISHLTMALAAQTRSLRAAGRTTKPAARGAVKVFASSRVDR